MPKQIKLNPEILDGLYLKYGYKQINQSENVKLYLYEQGRYYGADIISLDNSVESVKLCKKIKKEYGDGGYAAQIKFYENEEHAATELYKSFFHMKRRKREYLTFIITLRITKKGLMAVINTNILIRHSELTMR